MKPGSYRAPTPEELTDAPMTLEEEILKAVTLYVRKNSKGHPIQKLTLKLARKRRDKPSTVFGKIMDMVYGGILHQDYDTHRITVV